MTARDDRSAGPRVQASTVSGVTDHEPRRVLSLAYVSSDEELTIDSRLAQRYSRILFAALGSENTLAYLYRVRPNSNKSSTFVLSRLTDFHRTEGESAPFRLVQCAFDVCPDSLVTSFSGKLHRIGPTWLLLS